MDRGDLCHLQAAAEACLRTLRCLPGGDVGKECDPRLGATRIRAPGAQHPLDKAPAAWEEAITSSGASEQLCTTELRIRHLIHGHVVSVGADKSGAVFNVAGSVVKGIMVEIN